MTEGGDVGCDGNADWRHFDHDADIGVEGIGATPAEAFAAAARGMTAILCDPDEVAAKVPVYITCDAPDLELLLVDWLNALIFEMATRALVFCRFEVAIEGTRLQATAWGETVDIARHHPVVEIKGATYTALKVAHGEDGLWHVQCVVDV